MIDTILDVAARIDAFLWGPWTLVFIGSRLHLPHHPDPGLSRSGDWGDLPDHLREPAQGIDGGSGRVSETRGRPRAKERKKGRMTPFQATSTALASTVGMGSIAGIAVALSIGGPGAIFWMWLLALISTITKTAEITLAVHYRDIDETGRIRGGPMYYIRRGLGWPALATVFSLAIIVNALFSASLLQAHTVGRSFLASYGINPYLVAGAHDLRHGHRGHRGDPPHRPGERGSGSPHVPGLHRGRAGPLLGQLAGDSPGLRLYVPVCASLPSRQRGGLPEPR